MKKNRLSVTNFWFHRLQKRFSLPLFILLILVWAGLVFLYQSLPWLRNYDIPKWFPISVLYETPFHKSGVIYLILFILLTGWLLWKRKKINEYVLLAACIALVILGNLMQGGFEVAFIRPLEGTSQYLYEAFNVHHWREWLENFNANQAALNLHSKTHPPFAILIHNVFLVLFHFHVKNVAIGFAFLSLCAIPALMALLRLFDIEVNQRKLLLLLFSLLPAINIYSIVSLDGIIMAAATVFLLGIVILVKKPKWQIPGCLCMIGGLLLANALSFGALVLFGVGFFAAVVDLVANKQKRVLVGFILCIFSFAAFIAFFELVFHYNHIESFLLSSKMENPNGFSLFANPINYLLTRFEGISEIAFFLSFGVLTVFLGRHPLKLKGTRISLENPAVLSWISILLVLLLLISGAFCTGETARTCLFIYPFLILSLGKIEEETLSILVMLAGLQTAVMQMVANFFW